MATTPALVAFERFVLLAILRLGEAAYGVTIRREIAKCTEREPAPGALYTTLDRLEEKGLVSSAYGDPVARAQRAYQRLLKGLSLPGIAHA